MYMMDLNQTRRLAQQWFEFIDTSHEASENSIEYSYCEHDEPIDRLSESLVYDCEQDEEHDHSEFIETHWSEPFTLE